MLGNNIQEVDYELGVLGTVFNRACIYGYCWIDVYRHSYNSDCIVGINRKDNTENKK